MVKLVAHKKDTDKESDDWTMSYVGQTDRCINEPHAMRGHASNLKKDFTAHLSAHSKTSFREPILPNIRILGRSKDKTARELLEALHIKREKL